MASALTGCGGLKGLKQKKRNKSQMCVVTLLSSAFSREKRLCLLDLWASKCGQITSVVISDQQHKTASSLHSWHVDKDSV